MKITVFGATGRIGGQVVRAGTRGRAQGAAVVRESSRFEVDHPSLEVLRVPGLTDAEVLRPALDGSAAVISGVGARGRKDGPVASRAALARSSRRCPRSGSGGSWRSARSRSGRFRRARVSSTGASSCRSSTPSPPTCTPTCALMESDIMEQRHRLDDRPAAQTARTSRVTGQYRVAIGGNIPRAYSISRADAAHLMLAALDTPAMLDQPVGVAY